MDGQSSRTDHRDVEKMTITVNSVVECGGQYRARARVVALDATIWLEVNFEVGLHASRTQLWQQARDEVFRYLDVA